jgi:hypothetical protein
MDRLLFVLTISSIALIVLVLLAVRREHIRVEYSVSWLTAGFLLLVLSLVRPAGEWVASLLGVGSPPLAILIIVFCIFLVVFYRFSLRISTMKDHNIALAQRVAILEYHLKAANESQEGSSEPSA